MNKCFPFLSISLMPIFCYSQSEFELSKKIDSIINNTELSRDAISEGLISSVMEIKESGKKKGKIKTSKGKGGNSTTTYINYLDVEYYKTLPVEQKKKYHRKFELIKGKYHQSIGYESLYNENIWGEFYYQNNQLFYIKIKIVRDESNKKDKIEYFGYSTKELEESKSIKNEFLFDVQSWVREKNKEILKLYLKK